MENWALKVCRPLLLITFLLTLTAMPLARASPPLNVTVTTDKHYYIPEESIYVYGTLTQDGSPVEDGLVALQVDDPYNSTVAIRTGQTGTPSTVGPIEIVEAFPCDPGTGFPKDSFQIKEFLGVNVVVNNTASKPHYARVVINAYDASGVTLGIGAGGGMILPGDQSSFILPVPIPITAYTGNAIAYAGVYTDWPILGGVSYCPETSVSYEIVEAGGSSVPGSAGLEAQSSAPGTYNVTLKLSTNAKAGTYTVYASSSYGGESATASTTFNFEVAFPIVVAGQTFYIVLETNSTLYNLSNFKFNETFTQDGWRGEFSFSATGPWHPDWGGTLGLCNLTIPNDLWTGNPSWMVLIDGIETSYDTYPKNETHTFLTFHYIHTENPRKIQIYGTWVNPGILVHDVAVVSITAPMYATPGDILSIGVEVKNEGSYTEKANVTLYYHTTYIGSQNVTLAKGASETAPFTWNTSGLTPGSYTLNATATIPVDDDPTDNTKTTTIEIKLPVTYTLTVNSNPISGIEFTVDATIQYTPWSDSLVEGFHTVVMPATWTVGADVYNFDHWEDTSTNPARTISLTEDTTVTATYELYVPLLGWIEGTVTDAETGSAILGATVTADGISNLTDAEGYYKIEITPGNYTVTASMLGYYDEVATGVSVSEGETTTVNVTLTPMVHDVAVIDVTAPSFEVDVGEPVTISMDIANEGDFPETVEVMVSWEEIIGTKTVTLAVGESKPVQFTWDTTDVPLGRYTITVEASVAVDDDPTDNTITTEWGIDIIPEFPTLIPLLLTLAILAVSTIILKRRTQKPLTRRTRQ